jgi:UDP:flavonoid glycosyltransferase YjiC (YdhE family)
MNIKERSDEKMRDLYGQSLAALSPPELAARLILAYLNEGDRKGEKWYKKAEQMDRKNGEGKLIAVSCHTGFLAHTGRPLLVAKALRELGADVVFMAAAQIKGEDEQGRYACLIREEGFRIYDSPSAAGVRWIMHKAQVEAKWGCHDEKMVREEVQTQRSALHEIIGEWKRKPDAILTDLSYPMSITAEAEGIPLVSILNFTWTNHARIRHTPPEFHITTKIHHALGTDRINEYLSEKFGVTTLVLRIYLVQWVMPFNRVRKSLGLRTKSNFFDQMAGELILMPDFAAFKGMEITDTALPIGPLAWEPKDEEILARLDRETAIRFQVFLDSTPERPLIYLTMGSTGTLELFRMVIAALKDKPYRLAITTGGQFDISSLGELPSNIFAIPFFPGNRILKKTAVTIDHGGSGSAYQAMAAQVPQVMIPTHPDQQWNADIVQGEGAGIRLRHRELTEAEIADAVETLLKRKEKERT